MASGPPAAVRVAAALVGLEAVAALAAAVALVVVLARGAQMPGASAALAVIALGFAAALTLVGRALWRGGRRWARSPALTVQVLLGAMAVAGWTTTPQPWPVVAVAVAVAVVGALLAPAAVRWTMPAPAGPPSPTSRA